MTVDRPYRMPSRAAFRQFLLVALLISVVKICLAQSNVELAHFSSLHLFANGDTDSSNAHALSEAVRQLNRLADGHAAVKFAIVTGTLGVQQIFQPDLTIAPGCGNTNTSITGQRRLVQSARNLSLALQSSKIPSWLFLPGRGDRLRGCRDELAAFHALLAEARRQSVALSGPVIIDLSQQASFNVDGLVVLGIDSSAFDHRSLSANPKFAALQNTFQTIQKPLVLIAVSWPRGGDPLPTAMFLPTASIQPAKGWILSPQEQQIWLEIIGSDRVPMILAGDLETVDRTPYTDFHGLFAPGISSADLTKMYIAPPLGRADPAPKLESVPRGFEILGVSPLGRIDRVLYWYAGDAFRSQPSSEFQLQSKIGEMYEQAGQRTQAAAAYRKALDLASGPERETALHNLARVLNSWGFYELWMQNRRRVAWIAATLVLFAGVVVVVWLFWRRKRRLRIYSLDVPNDAKVPAAHLEQVGEYLVGMMRYYAAKTGPIGATKLPFIWSGFSQDLAPLLEQLIPGKGSGIASWLLGWLFQPEFTLRGTLAVSAANAHIILTLSRHGNTVHSWEKSVPADQTHDTLKDLVYAVLLRIKSESG